MSETLSWKDSITRTGYTEIDGKKVMQHVCSISMDAPYNMTVNSVKINEELYKSNRDVCRADAAEFEDACYELQKTYLAKRAQEVSEE